MPQLSRKKRSLPDDEEEQFDDEQTNQMPQLSRKKRSLPDDEEEQFDDEQTNQMPQLSRKKRSLPDEEEEQFDGEQTSQHNIHVNRSQLDNCLQKLHAREVPQSVSVKGEPGHIQQITLNNLMCHENFTVNLGPRINFIIGPNGSGKSAILAAIILGLGARASNTNRGSGLNSFIKTGQTRAKISIKLCNYIDAENRYEAYLPDKYGKSITVERVIYASGASNYKVRNEANKVISQKKEEVENITKHFQILVDNPVCVLTQEVSKNFLNSKNPKDKFKFFVKATQLEDVKRDYESAFESKENSIRVLKDKGSTIKMYEKKLKDQEKQVRLINMLKNSAEKMQFLTNEGFWALVNVKQGELDKLTKDFESIGKKCLEVDQEIESANGSVEQLNAKKRELIDNLRNLSDNVESCKLELEKATQDAERAERELSAKQREIQRSDEESRRNKMNISQLEKRIRDIELKNKETQETNFEAELEQVCAQMQALQEEQDASKEKIAVLTREKEELQKKRAHYQDEQRRAMALFNSANSEIERLNRGQKNKLDRYGNNFSNLLKEIDSSIQAKLFKRRPYGPIGEYIRLQDGTAALAAETLLKKNLKAFVVDNFDDSKVLQQIFYKVLGRNNVHHPDIIIRKYGPLHNVTHHQAQSSHPNFLQLFNIAEPEVANCLIDHNQIERIIYIPEYREAQKLLINPDTSPHNCQKAFTAAGDMMFPATDRTDYKCYPNKGPKMARILVQDCQQAMEEYRQNAARQKQAAAVALEQVELVTKEYNAKRREFDEVERSINEQKAEFSRLEKKQEVLKEKSQFRPVEVIALKEEISKYASECESLQSEIDELTIARDERKQAFIVLNTLKDEKAKLYKDTLHSRQPTKAKIDNIDKEIANAKRQHERYTQMKEEVTSRRSEIEGQVNSKREELESCRQNALNACNDEVIETSRKYDEVINEVKALQAIINENKEMADEGNQKKVIDEYRKLDDMVGRLVGEYREISEYIQFLHKSIIKRKDSYLNLRFFISRVVNFFFTNVLKQKEFTGSITPYFYDMEDEDGKTRKAKTLEVVIYPRKKEQFTNGSSQYEPANMYSSTKSLSGGERSFSTVAFIIALWQICPSPFRLLDEVDVFMDMVTRKISIDTLIWFATERSSKQFIFLSPLRMQQMENPQCVTINYMPEPIRN